jgi:cysteinyl-tRNA synthetase
VDTQLYLTNTLSKRKELFKSREEGKVKLFTCGPSTYGRAHVGNYRTFLYEDVLQRYMEYLGYQVERMINFTDVEDKAIAEAQDQGVSLKELTGPVEDRFFKEADLLSIKLPGYIPRASTSVDQAVQLIKILLDKGYA